MKSDGMEGPDTSWLGKLRPRQWEEAFRAKVRPLMQQVEAFSKHSGPESTGLREYPKGIDLPSARAPGWLNSQALGTEPLQMQSDPGRNPEPPSPTSHQAPIWPWCLGEVHFEFRQVSLQKVPPPWWGGVSVFRLAWHFFPKALLASHFFQFKSSLACLTPLITFASYLLSQAAVHGAYLGL
jgi:hypothetical protein